MIFVNIAAFKGRINISLKTNLKITVAFGNEWKMHINMNVEMKRWTDRGLFTGFAIKYKYQFFPTDCAGLPDFFSVVDCVAFLYKSCTIKTSTLFVATYIYTYSGDAPMNARWVQLLCMINTFITNQYKSMASLKMSTNSSFLCCNVEVVGNPLSV